MKWTAVNKTPPLKTGLYLVAISRIQIQIASFNTDNGLWTISDSDLRGLKLNVTHWMELPESPKDE